MPLRNRGKQASVSSHAALKTADFASRNKAVRTAARRLLSGGFGPK
ncbi:hypothetical protein HMPREF9696_02693 [Afipia clevelandensis ATCC 49720]|uniref:Uncharacterized protein n=1 Tax=Afipia clevelandensis ATCC 49720 TaxID=883079 RepID=K8P550_9BRAD|nr:hypothetical protein HMPREF9696_02693 [Afipia clevelandensis ATCC 49720]